MLVLDLDRLKALTDGQGASLEADMPGIEEPITGALGRKDKDVWRAWEASAGTWEDSLRIVQSLRCPVVVPPSMLHALDARTRAERTLVDHLAWLQSATQRPAVRP